MGAGSSRSIPVLCSATTVRACWQDLVLAGTHGLAEGRRGSLPAGKGALARPRTSYRTVL